MAEPQLDGRGWTVTPQAFEGEIFGAPVWRLGVADANRPPQTFEGLVEAARESNVALVACRIPADAPASAALEAAGFRQVERLVTFRRPTPASCVMPEGVSIGSPIDAEAVAQVARTTFASDRYHADPEIAGDVADTIKERWARNGVNGRADAALVVRKGTQVAGFNLCVRRGDRAAIDLIGVAAPFRGQGIGRRLVEAAFARYSGRVASIEVGTQETNLASIALYRSAGFERACVEETWHWTPRRR